MKPFLSENDKDLLGKRIAEAEEITGSQIVLATVRRSDNYRELPWKAFALGASVTGMAVLAAVLIFPGWSPTRTILISVVSLLSAGALSALLAMLLPRFARLFLNTSRAEVEVRQYAESLFLP